MFSMSSVCGRGGPSRSSSAIVADTACGYHDLKIDGYSCTKELSDRVPLKSPSFTVGSHRWRIEYRYCSSGRGTDHIFLHLVLDGCAFDDDRQVRARFQFGLMVEKRTPFFIGRKKKKKEKELVFTRDLMHWSGEAKQLTIFSGRAPRGGYTCLYTDELERSRVLKDDSYTIRCNIIVENGSRTMVSVPTSDLGQHLASLLRSGTGADVVFAVGGETFAAHRWLLAARSPVFKAELYGATRGSDAARPVAVSSSAWRAFEALLCFAYTDALPEMGKEEEQAMYYQHLLAAADKYNMKRLKLVCADKLCAHIDVNTTATILALAEQHHCDGLKKACFDFLLSAPENLMGVMASDGYLHLSTNYHSITKDLMAMLPS